MTDPLNINIPLAGVETSMPVLPQANYDMQIPKAQVEPNKDKTGFNLVVSFATTQPATSLDGREVKPGFPCTGYFPLQAKEDAKDPEFFRTKLSELLDAAFHTDKTSRPALTNESIGQLIGKIVRVTLRVENKPDGTPGNSIGRLQKAV